MKLSISRKKLSLMCLLIPFIEPQFFQTIKWVHFAYKYWGYFTLVMLCVCFFANQIKSQKIESDKCTVILLLYSLWLLASCFKNHTPISIYLSNCSYGNSCCHDYKSYNCQYEQKIFF